MSNYDFATAAGKRRNATSQYGASAASSAYSRFLSQQRGTRQVKDMTEAQNKYVPQMANSYSQRRLAGPGINSGIYRQALTDYATKQNQLFGEQQAAYNAEQSQFDITDAGLLTDYKNQMNDIEDEYKTGQTNTAATLAQFKKYLT